MGFIVVILVIIIIIMAVYIVFLRGEIRSMGKQLLARIQEGSRQPVSLALLDKNLGKLAIAVNKSLKMEEELRINAINDENRIKEMIADISHDLRTPLTAVKGYLELMEKGEMNKDQQEKLGAALRHVNSLGELIEEFFQYSYFMNVEPEINPEKINVNNLVADCVLAQFTAFEEKKLEVEFMETPPAYIVTDRILLTRIVQNLTGNCLRHSVGKISVRVESHEDITIEFANPVADPDKIDVKKIFTRFYTGDRARSKSTGLGLSIVELLAQTLGGKATAELHGNILNIRISLPQNT